MISYFGQVVGLADIINIEAFVLGKKIAPEGTELLLPNPVSCYEITGSGTLTADFNINVESAFTPASCAQYSVYWNGNLTVGSNKVYLAGVDITSLVSGIVNTSFTLTYLSGSWSVYNINKVIGQQMAGYAPLASPTLTGTPNAPVPETDSNSAQIPTTSWVRTIIAALNLSALAPKASPALTGTPTAPTPSVNDDSTKIATTSFVNAAIGSQVNYQTGLTAWAAGIIDLSTVVSLTQFFNIVIPTQVNGNVVLNLPAPTVDYSEVTLMLKFSGAFTVDSGTHASFAQITGANTHTSVLTLAWNPVTSLYILKSFSQN